ncbi:MAG: 3'-5' exonuclease [Planctomycetota bacterium]|nr:MAG: 3'-5' exonuclease [Planctomycetota bacterium]
MSPSPEFWKKKTLGELEFVAMDTETTGLEASSRIIELAGVRFSLERELGVFPSVLIHPSVPIPPQSTEIHGITDEMVRQSPRFEVVIERFLRFGENAVWLAHNAWFDVKMLSGEFRRLSRPFPSLCFLDTYALSRCYLPQLPNHRLQTVAAHFQLNTEGLHRAQKDAFLVKEIFLRLFAHRPSLLLEELGPLFPALFNEV